MIRTAKSLTTCLYLVLYLGLHFWDPSMAVDHPFSEGAYGLATKMKKLTKMRIGCGEKLSKIKRKLRNSLNLIHLLQKVNISRQHYPSHQKVSEQLPLPILKLVHLRYIISAIILPFHFIDLLDRQTAQYKQCIFRQNGTQEKLD